MARSSSSKHFLVPSVDVLDEKEALAVFQEYGLSKEPLPVIPQEDAALTELAPNIGDVVKFVRPVAGGKPLPYYRLVID